MWNFEHKEETDFYLGWSFKLEKSDDNVILAFLVGLGSWWLIF